ncbi:ribonuclease E inhibitor RraB [Pelagibaculum spongiae]|uniref:Ribonuclease E inhibitor RraB n=1 Tax=Pelagibaculum spongiae TaxID=2080658 RepID=A0A2V1GXW0_9GAMM|nr:ribonuclease E inhibitor RraB [Pelagibaculum spongiae]PVZ65384.1 ribonuclease E inhibitor RraB [Pelagibaculum spongiae]
MPLTRNPQQFPSDKTGDALWQMQQSGDQLQQPREIEFSIAFSDEDAAAQFAQFLLLQRQKVMLRDEPESAEPVEVLVWVEMEPDHQQITGFEDLLLQHAKPLGGKNAGWGCFGVKA